MCFYSLCVVFVSFWRFIVTFLPSQVIIKPNKHIPNSFVSHSVWLIGKMEQLRASGINDSWREVALSDEWTGERKGRAGALWKFSVGNSIRPAGPYCQTCSNIVHQTQKFVQKLWILLWTVNETVLLSYFTPFLQLYKNSTI